MAKAKRLPPRGKVKKSDTWDLSRLFRSDAAWERAFAEWSGKIDQYEKYRGKLRRCARTIADCLTFDLAQTRELERLYTYASLKASEDLTNSTYQAMEGRILHAYTRAGEIASFIQPEILAIGAAKLRTWLKTKCLAPYRILLERLLDRKPHTLSRKEERLLAMQGTMAEAAGQAFEQLDSSDMTFGTIRDDRGREIELTHGTFSMLLESPKRRVRRKAFTQYYQEYADHQHTLAATLNGSIQSDVYYARARKYPSALAASLKSSRIPVGVYDQLIESVHRGLGALHRYYDVRRRKMGLRDIHVYDTYVPIVSEAKSRHTWDQAVELVLAAVAPLGGAYVRALAKGLRGRWCDRYENRGKATGAFSGGCYDSDPYILMNYQPQVLNHVFTLAHEAGHSMHSYYSCRKQPYQYHGYTLFLAEVVSTLNEELLSRHLLDRARGKRKRAHLVNRQLDAMRSTIFRQTMFAEFEKITHERAEAGEPLTVDAFKQIYHDLLAQYFGPKFVLDEALDLECFRIPHFYRAFYVYQYATGMSGAIALAQGIVGGGKAERDAYLTFLGGGCSKDSLDLLRDAGVDLEQPGPVDAAMARFGELVDELDSLL